MTFARHANAKTAWFLSSVLWQKSPRDICDKPMHNADVANAIGRHIAILVARNSMLKVEYAEDAGTQKLWCRRVGFVAGETRLSFGLCVPLIPSTIGPPAPGVERGPPLAITPPEDMLGGIRMAQAVSPQGEQPLSAASASGTAPVVSPQGEPPLSAMRWDATERVAGAKSPAHPSLLSSAPKRSRTAEREEES